MRVADILKTKGMRTVMTVRPGETINALSERLRQAGVGAMIVSENGHTIDGIISERDVAYGVAAHAGRLHALQVSELMTRAVITCTPDDSISGVAKIMTDAVSGTFP